MRATELFDVVSPPSADSFEPTLAAAPGIFAPEAVSEPDNLVPLPREIEGVVLVAGMKVWAEANYKATAGWDVKPDKIKLDKVQPKGSSWD